MISREQWNQFVDHPVVEWTIFGLGLLLMTVVTPLVSILPGPGGVFVFALGLAMVLKTSMWAKRRYVRFKRWQPKAGRWADWGLRRQSAKRREAIRKEQEGEPEPATDPANIGQAPAQPPGGTPLDVPQDPWPESKVGSN